MELREAVRSRRSIRQFLPQPVPVDTIEEIITGSLWAPSWGNTQPWQIVVASGEKLGAFKKRNREALLSGKAASPDIPMPQEWPAVQLNRYKDLGRSVLAALGIGREDKEARLAHFAWMFELFDAPAAVLVAVDDSLALEYAMLDAGIFLQTFCLLAHDRGLGTCIMAALVSYPGIVRDIFDIPEDKRLVMGVALGWPDTEAPVNRFERKRGSAGEFVKWIR